MLRVVLHTDAGLVDLDTKEVSLQINFSATDITKLGSNKSAHSLAFKLPFSDINNEALGFFDLVDNSSETRVPIDCDIYDEGALILVGILSIRSCDLQSRTYDCVVYAKEAGVWQLLKTSKWQDVFTSDSGYMTTLLDHNHTAEKVVKSNLTTYNDVTDGGVGDDVIWYPMQYTVARTSGQDDSPLLVSQCLGIGGLLGRWWAKDFLPAIQIQYLLEQVFLHCGYTLDTTAGVFATSSLQLDKLYQLTPRENLSYRPYFSPYVSSVNIVNPDASGYWDTPNYPSSPSFRTLAFAVWQPGDADPDNFFQAGANLGGFVPDYTGFYNMRLHLKWEFNGTPYSNRNYIVGVQPYIFTTGASNSYYQSLIVNTDEPNEKTIDFQYYVDTDGVGRVFMPLVLFSLPTGATGFRPIVPQTKLQMVSYVGDSPKISVPNSLGKDTVDKWLGAIMTQFNLLLTTNEEYKTCVLHEKKEYYETDVANAKDWTDRVDRGKSMVVTNNLETLFKLTKFMDKEGDDGKSKWLQEQYNVKHTDWTYNSGVKLAKPETTVGNYFAPCRYIVAIQQYGTASTTLAEDSLVAIMGYSRTSNVDVSLALNKTPMLVYKGDDMTWPDNYTEYKVWDNIVPTYTGGYAKSDVWKQPQPFRGNQLLSWSYKSNYDGFPTNLKFNLFQTGYEDEMRKKYSKDARNLECEMWLDPLDIENFDYSDLITIDGIYYSVNSINNYVVGSRKSSKVSLNKVIDVEQVAKGNFNCVETSVGGISQQGAVTFVDRDGLEVTATQACCEFHGGGQWIWNAANETCHTGSVLEEDYPDSSAFRGVMIPSPSIVFDPAQVRTIINGTDGQSVAYKFKLVASTKSNTVAYAKNHNGDSTFYVPQDCVAAMTIEYVAKVVSTTDFGQMEFGKLDATYRVEDTTIVKVSTDGTIIKNGDASSVSCAVSVSYASGVAAFTVDCLGHNGVDMEWILDVQMTLDPIRHELPALPQSITLQDGDELATEADELMTYEL
jgi:hypothetical protein